MISVAGTLVNGVSPDKDKTVSVIHEYMKEDFFLIYKIIMASLLENY
ncbi:MAG: hypothetical protein CM15mP123_05420 [Gammaproteobacteria bacterium]|nr:MAG: hypothetical protein CM15mP123_05420 [Gammaproteobacteria bacterium]